MSTEIELKLLVAGKDVPRLRAAIKQHGNGSKPHRKHLVSHYFDTTDLQLWQSGLALRVRKVGKDWVQALKGDRGVHAGIHQRAEWETPVKNSRPDFDRLEAEFPDDARLQQLIKELRQQQNIQPIFLTDFKREAITLCLPDGSEVEAAIDEGQVLVGNKHNPVSELELELKAGDPVAIFGLARQLLAIVPLTIGTVSKAERGYALVQKQARSPRFAQSIQLSVSTTVDEAFVRIFSECVSHILDNAVGAIAGRDPEYVHQTRVAIRRFRAALAVFGEAAPGGVFADIAAKLQDASQILGEARNLDVLRDSTLPAYERETNVAISAELADRLQQDSRQLIKKTRQLLRSRQFVDALLAAGACILGRHWRQIATESTLTALSESAGVFARQAIEKRHRKLKRRVAAIDSCNVESLHVVRIAAKKLRYPVQFFGAIFSAKRLKPYMKALADIQGALGEVNDMTVASELLGAMAETSQTLLDEVDAIQIWLKEQLQRDQADFHKAWRRFSKHAEAVT